MRQIAFTDIDDIRVGHAHDLNAGTGCTVVICENGATAGIDVQPNFIVGTPGESEDEFLETLAFIRANHALHTALRELRWATFARLYNGPDYRANLYDARLARAYARYAADVAPDHPQPQEA